MSSNQSPSPRRILAVAVVAAGIVNGVLAEMFPLLFRPLGIVSGRLFADAIVTAVSSLAPMVFVFAACRRAAITRLRRRTIAGIALIGGIVGRYAGTAIGSVLGGQEVPSPVVLATRSDLSVGMNSPIILLAVLLGVIVAGVWPLVGAFGGVGLAHMESSST